MSPDWKSSAVSPADATALVRSGTNVFIHGACATPAPLIEALCARHDLEGVKLYHLHTAGPAPFAATGREREFRSVSLFTGAPLRQAVAEDRADFIPIFLSDIPALFLSGSVPLDVALPIEGVPEARSLAVMREIPQPAVASVFLGYRRSDVTHPLDGFGMLTPAVEKRRILGTLFSSTLFPGRAPSGHVALTTFVGGSRQPELCDRDDAALVAMVQEELADLLGVHGTPVISRVQRWPRAISQYVVGFQKFKDACYAVEAAAPGLFLGGPCCDGVSLSNCIGAGQRLAEAAGRRIARL